jgi:hypothetical protein
MSCRIDTLEQNSLVDDDNSENWRQITLENVKLDLSELAELRVRCANCLHELGRGENLLDGTCPDCGHELFDIFVRSDYRVVCANCLCELGEDFGDGFCPDCGGELFRVDLKKTSLSHRQAWPLLSPLSLRVKKRFPSYKEPELRKELSKNKDSDICFKIILVVSVFLELILLIRLIVCGGSFCDLLGVFIVIIDFIAFFVYRSERRYLMSQLSSLKQSDGIEYVRCLLRELENYNPEDLQDVALNPEDLDMIIDRIYERRSISKILIFLFDLMLMLSVVGALILVSSGGVLVAFFAISSVIALYLCKFNIINKKAELNNGGHEFIRKNLIPGCHISDCLRVNGVRLKSVKENIQRFIDGTSEFRSKKQVLLQDLRPSDIDIDLGQLKKQIDDNRISAQKFLETISPVVEVPKIVESIQSRNKDGNGQLELV